MGYASARMLMLHLWGSRGKEDGLKRLNPKVKVRLLIGMYAVDGIAARDHESFVRLSASRVQVRYLLDPPPIHAKLYVWRNRRNEARAFVGSANYSWRAFFKTREALVKASDPDAVARQAEAWWDEGTDCRLVADPLIAQPRPRPLGVDSTRTPVPLSGVSVEIPLTEDAKGEKAQYGLNWSFGKKRKRKSLEESYLFLPEPLRSFFPPRRDFFYFTMDDGFRMVCVAAQPKEKGASLDVYTAIQTPESNSILGAYLRRRIGDHIGKDLRNGRIGIEDLKAYGRLEMRVWAEEPGAFRGDFAPSVPIA